MSVLDAESRFAEGTLRPATQGMIRALRRAGQPELIVSNIAQPIGELAKRLRDEGDKPGADSVLLHAVHDGIDPSFLAHAIEANAAGAAPVPVPVPFVPDSPTPPPATDLKSALVLLNWIRDQVDQGAT